MSDTVSYTVIYDGDCNLCSTLVQWVEHLDRGQRFRYLPMQDHAGLAAYGVTPADCERGMLLIDDRAPDRRWQGSDAAEEMARLLPGLAALIAAYRRLPGMKPVGDRLYGQVRDHRYDWFGRRPHTYRSRYPVCETGCDRVLS